MITLIREQANQLQVSLSRDKVDETQTIDIKFHSPSRGLYQVTKSLNYNKSGFFSISLDASEILNLKDDSYSYQILQNGVSLKRGHVNIKA